MAQSFSSRLSSLVSIFLIHILFLFPVVLQAQGLNLEWAKKVQSRSSSIAYDIQGNVYITGYFSGTKDFDPDSTVYNITSNGEEDVFIQKNDANGNFIWAKGFGGESDDKGIDIEVDVNGNVYVTGSFRGDSVDFDPGIDSLILNSSLSLDDLFLTKFDSNGNFKWVNHIGKSYDYYNNWLQSTELPVVLDTVGNIYISGSFMGDFDFGQDTTILDLTSYGISSDIFIVKFDSIGNPQWVKQIEGNLDDHIIAMDIDRDGNLYMTGTTGGTIDFDPGIDTFNITCGDSKDNFVLKLDSDGEFHWAKTFGSGYSDYAKSISVDTFGNVFIVGLFRGVVDFDPGLNEFILSAGPSESYDYYIQKFDQDGNFEWAKMLEVGDGIYWLADLHLSVENDLEGNVYFTGRFKGTLDFDPGLETFEIQAEPITFNGYDYFVEKLDTDGNFIWAKLLGGIEKDMKIDTNENIYLTGIFNSSNDFDPTDSVYTMWSGYYNVYSAFYQKIGQCTVESGIYRLGGVLFAEAVGEEYQWVNCSNWFDIVGENSQSFTPSVNGNYAVKVIGDSCIGMSPCLMIADIGIEENTSDEEISIYPNPNSGIINIDLGSLENTSIKVFNVLGSIIFQEENIDKSTFQFNLNTEPGVYIIEIIADGVKKEYNLVKK